MNCKCWRCRGKLRTTRNADICDKCWDKQYSRKKVHKEKEK